MFKDNLDAGGKNYPLKRAVRCRGEGGGVLRRLPYILLLLGGLALICFGWARQRVSVEVMMSDNFWPRPFPYPDGWLVALDRWYDVRHPVPGHGIKMDSEWQRVRETVLVACVASAATFVCGAVPLINRWTSGPRRGRGFELAQAEPKRRG